jgi:non-heme chloroperoxidase
MLSIKPDHHAWRTRVKCNEPSTIETHPDKIERSKMSASPYRRLPGTPDPNQIWKIKNGMSIAADSWGDVDAPSVVLLHGGGQTRHAWKHTGERLGAAGFRTIAFDARGHGDSSWAGDGNYSHDSMVDDLKGLIDELDIHPVLVGASMGGLTSLIATGEGHISSAGLVLVDIAPRIKTTGYDRVLDFMRQKPDGFATLEEAAAAISSYQHDRPRRRNLDGLAKNLRLDRGGLYRWHWDPLFERRDSNVDDRIARLEECSRNLRVPTLLIRGRLSDLLTEQGAQDFLRLCPHSEYVNIAGAGHMIAGEQNDGFTDAVIDFVKRNASPLGRLKAHNGMSSNSAPS